METAIQTEPETQKGIKYRRGVGRAAKQEAVYDLMLEKFEFERKEIDGYFVPTTKIQIKSLNSFVKEAFILTSEISPCKVLDLFGQKTIDEIAGEMSDVVLFLDTAVRQVFPEVEINSAKREFLDKVYLDINYTVPGVEKDAYFIVIGPDVGSFGQVYKVNFITKPLFYHKKSLTLLEKIIDSPSIVLQWGQPREHAKALKNYLKRGA